MEPGQSQNILSPKTESGHRGLRSARRVFVQQLSLGIQFFENAWEPRAVAAQEEESPAALGINIEVDGDSREGLVLLRAVHQGTPRHALEPQVTIGSKNKELAQRRLFGGRDQQNLIASITLQVSHAKSRLSLDLR